MSSRDLIAVLLPDSRVGRVVLGLAVVLMLFLMGVDALRGCRRSPVDPGWSWTEEELGRLAALEARVEEVRKEGVYRLEGEHWLVQTEISERFTAEATLFMDLFHDVFSEMVVAPVVAELKPTLHVFRSKSAYEELFSDGSRGRFSYRWNGAGEWERFHLYTYVDEAKELKFAHFPKGILQHEGAHAMLQRYAGKHALPPWLGEGIATYYEVWSSRQTLEQNMENRRLRSSRLRRVGRESELPSLKWLTGLDYGTTWNPDHMGAQARRNYAYAESFVDYLMASGIGKVTLENVFWRVCEGRPGVPPLFESELLELQRGWHQHLAEVLR